MTLCHILPERSLWRFVPGSSWERNYCLCSLNTNTLKYYFFNNFFIYIYPNIYTEIVEKIILQSVCVERTFIYIYPKYIYRKLLKNNTSECLCWENTSSNSFSTWSRNESPQTYLNVDQGCIRFPHEAKIWNKIWLMRGATHNSKLRSIRCKNFLVQSAFLFSA